MSTLRYLAVKGDVILSYFVARRILNLKNGFGFGFGVFGKLNFLLRE